MPRTPAPPLRYERRLLVYADVLGWSRLVCAAVTDESEAQRLAEAVRRLSSHPEVKQLAEANPEAWRREIGWQVTQVSDSIAFSVHHRQDSVGLLLDYLGGTFSTLLLHEQLYVRGAVVVGDLDHRPDLIQGAALVEASRTEKTTKHPRIVIHDSAKGVVPPEWIQEDQDGVPILDYFRFSAQNPDLLLRYHVPRMREILADKIAAHRDDPSILDKDRWMLAYLDRVETAARKRHPGGG